MTNSSLKWEPSLDKTLEPILADALSAHVVSIDEFGTPAVSNRFDDWSGFDRKRLVKQILGPLSHGTRDVTYNSCANWNTWETIARHLVVERFLILEGVG